MILKIGRVPTEERILVSSNTEWEFTENVGNVRHTSDETKPNKRPDMHLVYYVGEECHATDLIEQDVCYLMTDEGKTIERIR